MPDNPGLHPANDKGERNFYQAARVWLKVAFLGEGSFLLYAASEQSPIYGADNSVAAACIAAKSL